VVAYRLSSSLGFRLLDNSVLGTAISRRVNSFMRSKAEGSGVSFAGALGGSVMATPSSDVIHNVSNAGSSIGWGSADAKDYKFNRCEIMTSRVLPIVGNNHEQMGNTNTQQYKADSLVPAPGGAKGYEKANCQRHSGKCQ
jgi:hypothetical protein